MAGNDATVRIFDALNDSYDAVIDRLRAANDRRHRFSTAMIEETQEGQREAAKLASKWADAPFDFLGFYSSLIETSTQAQGRALDVTRQWFGELTEAQREAREVFQRMVSANRAASQAALDFGRGIFSRAGEAVQSVAQSAAVGDGRRSPREPARASEAPPRESQADSEL